MQSFDHESLKSWFFINRRILPWRENPSPYEVWVSEVMLQQTRVSVVIPYFNRWMEHFPTISDLANAPIEAIIKIWEGLGYYSRARNLHEGAKYLVQFHEGELPDSPHQLRKVKGLGPYTIGAIRSFAFKQKAPAVDGNVLRVMARYFSILEEVDNEKVRKNIEDLVTTLLPQSEPWIVMEALIELGALVCQKMPKCHLCPLNRSCLARKNGNEESLPQKRGKIPIAQLHRLVGVIYSEEGLLLKRGEKGKIMADLWEFPYFAIEKEEKEEDKVITIIKNELGESLLFQYPLPKVSHSFTRFKAFLYPFLFKATHAINFAGFEWAPFSILENLPFSSGHRRILETVLKLNFCESI